MSTVATGKPQTFTPYVPGTRNAFVQDGNLVRVSWTPDTGTARVYAATELLATREGVESMTLVDAQAWIAEVLEEITETPVYKHYATHRRVLVPVTPRTPMGISMKTVEHATFTDALTDASREAAQHDKSMTIFCDAITVGHTTIAEVAPSGEVTYVNDYANPERREISAPETPVLTDWERDLLATSTAVSLDDDQEEGYLTFLESLQEDGITLVAPDSEEETPVMVARITIQPRTSMGTHPMRGHAGRNSDVVTSWSRVINGKTFDFSRIVWGEGGTTLRVFVGGKTTQLHTWFAN